MGQSLLWWVGPLIGLFVGFMVLVNASAEFRRNVIGWVGWLRLGDKDRLGHRVFASILIVLAGIAVTVIGTRSTSSRGTTIQQAPVVPDSFPLRETSSSTSLSLESSTAPGAAGKFQPTRDTKPTVNTIYPSTSEATVYLPSSSTAEPNGSSAAAVLVEEGQVHEERGEFEAARLAYQRALDADAGEGMGSIDRTDVQARLRAIAGICLTYEQRC